MSDNESEDSDSEMVAMAEIEEEEEEERQQVEEPDEDTDFMTISGRDEEEKRGGDVLAEFKRAGGGPPDIENGVQVVDIESQVRRKIHDLDDTVVGLLQPTGNKRGRSCWGGSAACMRIYGKTHNGGSVCINVYGYYPVVRLLASCDVNATTLPIIAELVEDVLAKADRKGGSRPDDFKRVLSSKVVKGFYAFPYGAPAHFIEFRLALPEFTKPFGEHFLKNPEIAVSGIGLVRFMPYSCHNIVEQFQADRKVIGFGWIRLRRFSELPPDAQDTTSCEREINTNYEDVVPYHEDTLAPLRLLVFDIECLRRKGLPEPLNDAVIIIGCICVEYVDGEIRRSRKVVLQADTGADIPPPDIDPKNGDHYLRFPKNEKAMLSAFGRLINRHFDPDFIAGHNMQNFDLPYILRRANALGCDEASFLGRRRGFKWFEPRVNSQKRKNGTERTSTTSETPGRVQLDTMTRIMALRAMRSYSLNYLSSEFLQDTKSDVPYQMIGPMWKQSDETRSRLARYCLKDTVLTLGLIEYKDFCMVHSAVEMARQTRVCANKLLRSGMQVKVFGLLYEIATKPNWDKEGSQVYFPYEKPRVRDKDDKYDGAVVLEPSRGFYSDPVFCADFRSLYPTNIILLNIDWGTEVVHDKYKDLIAKTSPNKASFVSPETRLGLLPQMEILMMESRDAAKATMKKYKEGTGLYNLYNSRQDQLKAIMNSAYGILNASGGRLAREELALAVTSQGRVMINKAKKIAEAAPFNCRVVYGDTDSIMVQFPGVKTIPEGFPMLVDLCKAVTDAFAPSVVLLQAEKGMWPMLMMGKKRYVYNVYMGPNAKPKLAFKGVELARRDNCGLVPDVMKAAFNDLMSTGNPAGARKIINNALRELLGGRVDISKLVITKAISREHYKNRPEHVAVAKRMAIRDKSYESGTSERIPYIIVNRSGNTVADRAEDPLWAITHGFTPDVDYYIHHQLASPLARALMFNLLSSDEKQAIDGLENAIRKCEGDEAREKTHKDALKKLLEKIRKKVEGTLFGPAALADHPKKLALPATASKGTIGSFFQKAKRCSACKGTKDVIDDLCATCMTPPCIDCGEIINPGESRCEKCLGAYSECSSCFRLVKKQKDEPKCRPCEMGKCYACGVKTASGGPCENCANKRANKRQKIQDDVEDLDAMAAAAKAKCDKCRGYASDEIDCVARSCPNLFKRATIAAKIAQRDIAKK